MVDRKSAISRRSIARNDPIEIHRMRRSNVAGFDELMKSPRPFLTDAGMETWLFFQQGFEAPEFAAITLIEDDQARAALNRYFDEFLALAERSGTGFVLDTNTWRACTQWAPKLGLTAEELLRLTGKSVEFAKEVRERWQTRVPSILVNGVVGPAGDGYRPGELPDAATAQKLHTPQIEAMAEAGVDMISAITMTNVAEAIGVARAAGDVGLPVVISFTVETDGRLPTGDRLDEAIEAVDRATDNAPAYYMINCAHPDHFSGTLENGSGWISRVGGIRANASRLSHAELDEADELDEGNPREFGKLSSDFARKLPNLRVVGGCCGTDIRHIGCVADELLLASAA